MNWLCSVTDLPVLIKGIIHPEDARLAAEQGAAAVVVSNHDGRQLDTAPATVDVLPEIAAALDKRVPVIVDGGIRRGSDVVKAIALGATAVAIGRPVLWGLAVNGQAGISEVLGLLREDFITTMALCGCRNTAEIQSHLITTPGIGTSR